MADDCPVCPALRSQNAALQAEAAYLRRQVGELVCGIQSTLMFIDNETEDPTMPRQDLLRAIPARLGAVLNNAY